MGVYNMNKFLNGLFIYKTFCTKDVQNEIINKCKENNYIYSQKMQYLNNNKNKYDNISINIVKIFETIKIFIENLVIFGIFIFMIIVCINLLIILFT